MKNHILPLCIMFLLIGGASATYSITVVDINTLEGIETANVTIWNATQFLGIGNTDVNGLLVFGNISNDADIKNISVRKYGYFDDLRLVPSGSDVYSVSLFPISSTGIVRFHFSDLSLVKHETYCIKFDENDRIKECFTFTNNGSVQLLVNRNYTIFPIMNSYDMVNSPSNFMRWSSYLAGPVILAFIILAVITIMYKVVRL